MKLLVLLLGCLAVAHGLGFTDYVLDDDDDYYDNGDGGYGNSTGVVASVREYPSFLHKCSATFITESVLIGAATCLLCIGNCKFYIAVVNSHLEDSYVTVYEVDKILKHPKFVSEMNHNIALIYLKKNATNAFIASLPDETTTTNSDGFKVYAWLFDKSMKNFSLVSRDVRTITSELCSSYVSEYVSDNYLCVLGKQPLMLGPSDHGSPLIYNDGNLILGTFTSPGIVDGDDVVKYLSIFPYLRWIKDNVNWDVYRSTATAKKHKTTTTKKHKTTTTKKHKTTTKKP